MADTLDPKHIDALRKQLMEIAALPGDQADLPRAALLIAAEHTPDIDIPACLGQLEAWAHLAGPLFLDLKTARSQAGALIEFVRNSLDFEGNTVDYYDPANSYLDKVMERRVGIPITLALVYMAIGRRNGLEVHGVGFPGHFLVTVGSHPQAIIDPFTGKLLTLRQCQTRLTAALGAGAKLGPEHLTPATPREILIRMLRNLKHVFLERAARSETPETDSAKADLSALACCERLLLFLPDDPTEFRDRGFVNGRLGRAMEACADLERALELAPQAPWADAVREGLPALRTLAGPLN